MVERTSSDGPPSQLTKGERTQARLLDAAFSLFAERGYQETTVRDIASRAKCSVGLIYRYFPTRSAFATALYADIGRRLGRNVEALDGGTLSQRLRSVLDALLAEVSPHKSIFVGMLGAAFDQRSGASVLGADSMALRDQVEASFRTLVEHATDAPADEAARHAIARVLYVAHLGLLLVWTQDTSEGDTNTLALVEQLLTMLSLGMPFASLAAPGVASIASLIDRFMESALPRVDTSADSGDSVL